MKPRLHRVNGRWTYTLPSLIGAKNYSVEMERVMLAGLWCDRMNAKKRE